MDGARPAKRPRLSMACNECRRRKVKCDANYPHCGNCAQRKIDCITTDPKRPGAPVIREWIEDKPLMSSPRPAPVAAPAQSQQASTIPNANQPSATNNESTQVNSHSNSTLNHQNEQSAQTSALEDHSSETNEVSPVYTQYDMSFHLDKNTNRLKMMGASSSQCLIKSLDVYLESGNVKPVTPLLKYGMRHTEEMSIPLSISLPAFPALETRQKYINAFFKRIHPLWPATDVDETKSTIHALAAITNLAAIAHEQVPLLAIAYLIMSLGADEDARQLTEDGDIYLQAATSFLGHLILMPYLSAVQSLILFTVAYRGRNKDGLGWQTAGMAIRIAHSIGLHRHSAVRPSKQHGVTEKLTQLYHARFWGICCCLEKIIELEFGRPSAIIHLDKDQMMYKEQRPPGPNFLVWNMGLAELQNDICRHIYAHRPGDRTAKDILQSTARLDRGLLAWASEIMPEYQPENAMFCSNDDFHFAAFLAIQFHQTMIALHRAALIAPRGIFDAEVEKWCSEEPSKLRLQRGELICINSARAIIRLSLELSERKAESRILTAGPPLLASVALAIFLIKHPRGRSQATDLELLKAAVEYTGDEYTKSGQDRRMAQAIISIHEKVKSYFRHTATTQKRATGNDLIELKAVQDSTPSSKSVETASVEGSTSTNLPHTNRHHILQGVTTPEYTNTASDFYRPSAISLQQSPVNGINERNHLIPEKFVHRSDGPPVNAWTPTMIGQNPHHLLPGPNDGFLDNLSMSQDMSGITLTGDRNPFGEFGVEEMWNWMCVMDSTDDFPPITMMDPNV